MENNCQSDCLKGIGNMMEKILFATSNEGKVKEIKMIFEGMEAVSLK